MKIFIADRSSYAPNTTRTYTDEGFLKVSGRVARVGIYDYLASELGLNDRPVNQIVKVYRDPKEVFKDASLATYSNADVTNNHPPELVTADTYKDVTSGVVTSTGRQDGEFVVVDMIVKDAQTIRDIESGKVELSPGYTAIYDEAPDGADYDFVQRDITINHVALVPLGRGGNAVRLFDKRNEETQMAVKLTLDTGVDVEVADSATATLITKTLTEARQAVTDAVAKADKAEAKADAKDEELEELKKSTSDAAINARAIAISDARATADKIAGDTFNDAKSPVEIQRAALSKIKPTTDWSSKSNDYVNAYFDAEAEKKEVEDEEDEEAMKAKKKIAEDAAIKTTNDGKPLVTGNQRQRNALFGGIK